ncbi:MAG: type I-E CRISPR-associated protein Cse2/CasB [Lachnospiraceae bacterium]|nr:type I-E CRISPR-associated protein Cse2/CasB [Lachnospiraceae bacterium]
MSMNDVTRYVAHRLHKWESMGSGHPVTTRDLALMRRAVGKLPGEDPSIWGILFDGFPENLMSMNGIPSYAENAVFTALTAYALHQQGSDIHTHNMNQETWSLGRAVRALAGNDGNEEELARVRKRFNILATASNTRELNHYLYQVIRMLRAKNIPLDYPALARDLYLYQMKNGKEKVMLRWGEDFYRVPKTENKETENKGE